jgi:voltage-gated sodium channel
MHALIQKFVEHPLFGKSIMALIIINAIILGLETVPALMLSHGAILIWLDKIILKIFVVEIILRLYVYRGSFFKDPWNLFDFAIVTLTLIPASGQLSILRAFRILRVLRLITIIPALKRVVGALLASIPGLGAIGGLLMILFYVFAVMATKLFGSDFPDFFGSIPKSMYTLFEVMTLEGWSSGIVRPVMEIYPWA